MADQTAIWYVPAHTRAIIARAGSPSIAAATAENITFRLGRQARAEGTLERRPQHRLAFDDGHTVVSPGYDSAHLTRLYVTT